MKKSILETVHESAQDLHEIGLISNKEIQEFDELCSPPKKHLTPKLREKITSMIPAKNTRLSQHCH